MWKDRVKLLQEGRKMRSNPHVGASDHLVKGMSQREKARMFYQILPFAYGSPKVGCVSGMLTPANILNILARRRGVLSSLKRAKFCRCIYDERWCQGGKASCKQP
jgi:hypothetical protein